MSDQNQEFRGFSEATYNSLEFSIKEVSQKLSNCSLGDGPDQVPDDVSRAVFNNLSVHI